MNFEQAVDWMTTLATTPGWWAYASQRAQEMERDTPELFAGLRDAVRERVRVSGYRPPRSELGEWWEIPSKLYLENLGRRRW